MGGTIGGNAFVPIATGGKGVLAANQVQPVVRLRMKVAFTMVECNGDQTNQRTFEELFNGRLQ